LGISLAEYVGRLVTRDLGDDVAIFRFGPNRRRAFSIVR
jgi:hypothetical protein